MRRARRLLAIASTVGCCRRDHPGRRRRSRTAVHPRRREGVGDPYFPQEGNGGYDAQHYDIGFSYDPATKRISGTTYITAQATQDLSRLDLDLEQLKRRQGHRRRAGHGIHPRRPEADRHALAGTAQELTLRRRGDVLRGAQDDRRLARRVRLAVRLRAHRRRRVHGRRAERGLDLVPQQRPSKRQGRLHVPGDGAQGSRSDRQRPAGVAAHPGRQGDVRLGREGADGDVPGDRRHRQVADQERHGRPAGSPRPSRSTRS